MDNINPIKQNARIQQFFGWFMAVLFPFTIKGIIELTHRPIITALVYWVVCGILLRYIMDKKLPYFHPQVKKIKIEIIILIIATALCIYLCVRGRNLSLASIGDLVVIKAVLFAILNGCFEQLLWINIFDLAGCKKSILGLIAVAVYAGIMSTIFWGSFMPTPQQDTALFVILQSTIFIVVFFTYVKTNDITVWSIQNIIYNLVAISLLGFNIPASICI